MTVVSANAQLRYLHAQIHKKHVLLELVNVETSILVSARLPDLTVTQQTMYANVLQV